MDFRLLGPIEVVGDAGHVRLGGETARAVLAALMLRRGRTVSTEALVHIVWERPPATARHAIAVYVSRLRGALADAGDGRQPIITRRTGYALEIEPEELDLERFRKCAARGRAAATAEDWETAWATFGEALGMWRATPFACLTASPVIEARLELEDERLSLIDDRLETGLELGLHVDLLPELRTLTRERPERERFWEALMLALYRSGRQGEALQVFLEAHRQLDESFGIEPGPAIRKLQRRILEHDPSLLRTASPASVSLPSPPSSFVGRERELAQAAELIADGEVRLLTVVGTGGIGKTRFSIELARRLADRFRDGVWWVPLDALDEPTRVTAEIAAAVTGPSASDPIDSLTRELTGKRALLVLDCFEHVLDAAPDVYRLLERVPTLRMLVTSRERLGLCGEHLYWIPPLALADASALFLSRRSAIGRSRPPSDHVIVTVCERLDRIPLAIELVASQVDVHTDAELLATLERSLDVDGRRDPPRRHRTLRTTLDWSHALLDETARRALRRLAVFAGGFTLEAAEAVTGTAHAEMDLLESKSLVTAHTDPDRYRLLDTVRDYALERLAQSGESDSVSRAHAAWFVDLARSLEPDTYVSLSSGGHAVFASELPNFKVALRHAADHVDGRAASTLVRSLAPYLYASVPPREGRQLARTALSLQGADPIDRGHVLYYDAAVSMDMGGGDETRRALAEAESLFGDAGDLRGLSMVENLRCFHEATVGNYADAAAAGERSSAHARQASSEGLEAIAHGHLAFALLGLGAAGAVRDEAAIRRSLDLSRSAVERAEASETSYALMTAHANIVAPLLELDELEEALAHAKRAVTLEREHGSHRPYSLFAAADVARGLGEHETAIRLLLPCLEELARNSIALQSYSVGRAEGILDAARAALGADAFAAAERNAKAMTVDEAFELALTLRSPSAAARR